jgi:hypothetical protein
VNGGLRGKDLGEQRLELALIAEVRADGLNDRRLVSLIMPFGLRGLRRFDARRLESDGRRFRP